MSHRFQQEHHYAISVCSKLKLQNSASSFLELWNLMDTPLDEQKVFQSFTCYIATSKQEIMEPNSLYVDFIDYGMLLHALLCPEAALTSQMLIIFVFLITSFEPTKS